MKGAVQGVATITARNPVKKLPEYPDEPETVLPENAKLRFREEIKKPDKKINNYNKTLDRCHSTVGIAILNTSITIVFGFSILVLSNFIPTIYFGVFTGIAMLLAMISVLTLLPKLILTYKPFGEEKNNLAI